MLPLIFFCVSRIFGKRAEYIILEKSTGDAVNPASLIGKPVRIRRSPATVMASRLQNVTEAKLWEGAARR